MRKFIFRHILYLVLGSGIIVYSGAHTSVWAETISPPKIIATVNGEPLFANEAFNIKKLLDFSYFSNYDSFPSRSNFEEYQKYMRYAKESGAVYLQGDILKILQKQWMKQQEIFVTEEELETAWQNSEERKKFLKVFDEQSWKKRNEIQKIKLVSYKEASDPKHFPKAVYKPSQIEAYTAYLKKVHQKYFGNHKESSYRSFSEWAMELIGWVGLNSGKWATFEQIFSSPAGLEKFQFRESMEAIKMEIRILKILSENDLELKQCLENNPPIKPETHSKERGKCIGNKYQEFWETLYNKADIQIHDPELEPFLDLIRKLKPYKPH